MLDNTSYFMGQDGFHWFVGVVEDRNDPQKAGRVRVRCIGYHSDSLDAIPTATLPWATVMMPVTAGANSGIGLSPHFLIEGTWVVGFFRDPAKQEPVIMGALPGKNSKSTTNYTIAASSASGGYSSKGGFKDQGLEVKPTGNQETVYPTALYVDKTDTNVIAQQAVTWNTNKEEGEDHHPSFTVKGGLTVDDTVHTKWSNASGTEIQQAVSTQASSLYPFNHVLETEAGHYIEIDDTKDNERIHVYHKTGTFIEIDKTGNVILKTPDYVNMTTIIGGNSDTYVKGNYSLTVDGNMDIHCTGTENRTSSSDSSSDSSSESSDGESKLGTVTHVIAKGDYIETITEGNRTTTITAGTETVDIKGAVTHTYQDTLTETITKAVSQTYSDTLTLDVAKDVTETFGAALKTEITGTTNIEGTGAMTIKSGAALAAEAAAAATLKGSTVSFN